MFRSSKQEARIIIDITVKSTKDIFQQFGYSSIGDKILSKDFEEYIFYSIKGFSLEEKVALSLFVTSDLKDIGLLDAAIHRHFDGKAKQTSLQLRQQFKQWIINMIIGTLFLVLCLILVEILEVFSYINIIKIIKESLLIIGWVALWEPVTFILFGWRTIKREKLLYKKLACIPIIIKRC